MVTNLRPGPLGRLGLDYDTIREVRDDIVFCRAHGYPFVLTEHGSGAMSEPPVAEAGYPRILTTARKPQPTELLTEVGYRDTALDELESLGVLYPSRPD